jgi:hypothetical protein
VFASALDAETEAVALSEVPVSGALTEIEMVAVAAFANDGALHVTFVVPLQVKAEPGVTDDAGAGRAVVTVTPEASPGPWFVTVSVNVTAPPGVTGDGAAVIVTPRSAESAAIGTDAVPVALQLLTVAVACRLTLPLLPAVKVTVLVPCPLVSVPLAIVQAYVAPAMVVALAMLLADPAATLEGALTASDAGAALTTALPCDEQPPPATVTSMMTLPDDGAVKVMLAVPWPPARGTPASAHV